MVGSEKWKGLIEFTYIGNLPKILILKTLYTLSRYLDMNLLKKLNQTMFT